jgi:hypothetical protein
MCLTALDAVTDIFVELLLNEERTERLSWYSQKERAMRRATIFAIVLSLATVALAPALICALPLSQITKFDAAKTRCDAMDMPDSRNDASRPSVLAQSGAPCCMVSQAPRPEAQYSPGKPFVLIARLSDTHAVLNLFAAKRQISNLQEQVYSPPEHQSLLCTFLI